MGKRKCQNPTSQLDIIRKQIHFQSLVAGVGGYDKWGGEKRRNIFQGEILNQLNTCHDFSILFLWSWKKVATFILKAWQDFCMLVLRKFREEDEEEFIKVMFKVGGRPGKKEIVLIRWFSVHVRHRPPSRWLQGEKIQGVLEPRLMLPLVWNSLIFL